MGPVCAAKVAAEASEREAAHGVVVTVDGWPLHHVVRHSPTGMEWGYGGSGPADLALSILTDYLGDRIYAVHATDGCVEQRNGLSLAEQLHQPFKWSFVASFPREGWSLTGEQIASWLRAQGVLAPVRQVVYEGRRLA